MTRARSRTPVPTSVDVAVVGAGLSGLIAATYLAQAGHKVAVFDPHYVAGGCTTQFHRRHEGGSLRFDVGLHYIGETAEDGYIGRILRELGVEQEYEQLDPDGYDEFIFPDFRFRMPSDPARFRERLVALFPEERSGIDRYTNYLVEAATARHIVTRLGCDITPSAALEVLWKAPRAAFWSGWTLGKLIRSCTRNPQLAAVLAAQHGDYGMQPSRVPALYHAALVDHFSRGAFYPRGGGQAISDKVAANLEAAQGTIHLRRGITEIVVEGGRAVGVRCADPRGAESHVRAKLVLSCADLATTLLELVGVEHLPRRLVRKVQSWDYPTGVFMTFLGLQGDLGQRGLERRNYWQFDDYDFDGMYEGVRSGPPDVPHGVCVTSGSLKDPGSAVHAPDGVNTVELMALSRGDLGSWGRTPEGVSRWQYRKDAAYLETKDRIEANLVGRMEALFPGTASDIVFRESATPVSLARFTGATGGTGYGLAIQAGQFARHRPGSRTVIPGLYVCGSSTRNGPGIVAVSLSGRHAARLMARELGRPLGLSWEKAPRQWAGAE